MKLSFLILLCFSAFLAVFAASLVSLPYHHQWLRAIKKCGGVGQNCISPNVGIPTYFDFFFNFRFESFKDRGFAFLPLRCNCFIANYRHLWNLGILTIYVEMLPFYVESCKDVYIEIASFYLEISTFYFGFLSNWGIE